MLTLATLVLCSCASTDDIDTSTPEGLFKLGATYEKDERYEEALADFNDLRNKHPYSKYALQAELHIADINYKRENYVEAENSYKLFKEFHPKNKMSDFVTFRIAMSIFKQLPDSIDRDLSLAKDAILYFEQVYTNYPNSDYAGSARDHKDKSLLKLARKEAYIGDFYFIRDKYDSALSRYADVLVKYPHLGLEPRMLYGAASSAAKLNEKDKAQNFYDRLLAEFPKSKWTRKAKSALETKL